MKVKMGHKLGKLTLTFLSCSLILISLFFCSNNIYASEMKSDASIKIEVKGETPPPSSNKPSASILPQTNEEGSKMSLSLIGGVLLGVTLLHRFKRGATVDE